MEKWKKNPHSRQNSRPVPVQVRAVPVQVVLCFSILTSVRIFAITCSFIIRFELFKFLVKLDFNENQTS